MASRDPNRGPRESGQARPAARPGLVAGVASAVLVPATATGLALAIPRAGAAVAATLYLLGVVAASVVGGRWAGLVASILCFLGLNFFFTEPRHTFSVRRPQDLVALFVFLAVAAVVGALVSRLLEARDRAERRAVETARLQAFTSLLATDRPIGALLSDAAAVMVESFGLSRCSIELETAAGEERVRATAGPALAGDRDGPMASRVVASGARRHGSVTVVRPEGAGPLSADDERLLEAYAAQLALAADRARNEADARSARVEAETSKLRAALFSSVTHDLRTPLSSIKASVTGLLDSSELLDPGQRRELLRTILEEADRLNRLVGNLLDLARVRAGALTPSLERTGIEDVVEAVLGRLRPVLAPFALRTQIRPNLPDVLVDPVQMDQVLTNVLENAARFSPPGAEIRVAVAAFQGSVEVTVADHGPGIPANDRELVFEPFRSLDRGPGRGGTGLGLAIARAVVQAHGGRMWIEGAPGGGTAVMIRLPAAPEPAAAGATVADRGGPADAR